MNARRFHSINGATTRQYTKASSRCQNASAKELVSRALYIRDPIPSRSFNPPSTPCPLCRRRSSDFPSAPCLQDLQAMAAAAIRGQINVLIATMFNTGLVDDNFLQLQRMREQGRVTPAYIVEVMNRFLNDAEKIINDITGLMNEPEVDLDKMDGVVQQLKATTSSIGAKRLNLCCVQHFSPEAKNKEKYLEALGRVRFQFGDLRSMFKIIIELEQHFAACGPK